MNIEDVYRSARVLVSSDSGNLLQEGTVVNAEDTFLTDRPDMILVRFDYDSNCRWVEAENVELR